LASKAGVVFQGKLPYIQNINFSEITCQFPGNFISFRMCYLGELGGFVGLDRKKAADRRSG
jgi:hypothetical protein